MKIRIIIIGLLVVLAGVASAQKRDIAQARTLIKSGKEKELVKAEQMMRRLTTDSIMRQNTKVWLALTDAVRAQYLASNERLYLHQKQDTAAFFDLALKMFRDYEAFDSVEAKPNSKGRVDVRYRRHHAEFLGTYRRNLFNGGVYYLRRQDYARAFSLFDAYIDCRRQPLFEQQHYERDASNREAAYWTLVCGYQLKDREMALKYRDDALQDSTQLDKTLELLAEIYLQHDDKELREEALREGFRHYPESNYFFPRLIDHYHSVGKQELASQTVDEALKSDSTSMLFLFAKSSQLLNGGDYDGCIAVCDTLIARHGDAMPELYYNAGVAYLNKAFVVEKGTMNAKQRKLVRGYYSKAQPYIEHYRQLAPEDKDRWAAALYNIYLRLNMGKEFEEIERILKR